MSIHKDQNLYYTIAMTLLLLLISSSCIREEMNVCSEQEHTHFLSIKVIDPYTGEDITAAGEVENSYIYLFNEKTGYTQKIKVTAEQIKNREEILIESSHNEVLWASVWGNLNNGQTIKEPPFQGKPEEAIISVITDENGYATPPDNLFFGGETLLDSHNKAYKNTVTISPKNARIHITARNLQEDKDDEYYFVIRNNNYGYDLRGTPKTRRTNFKETGVFLPNKDFSSPSTLNIIHTRKEVGDYITIAAYKRADNRDEKDILIGSASADKNGVLIAPQAGETTNILLDFQEELKVYVEITSWNEIHHWIKW